MANIKSLARHYKWRATGHEHVIYKNVINGQWKATKPLEIVVSDMTVLSYRGRQYEWTYILDTYNNSIIASAISSQHGDPRPYFKCLKHLQELIKKEELTTPVYFHTDQGAVYSSAAYNKACTHYNIIRSMSRVGTPTDNAIIESINGWIKAEMRCDYRINDWDTIEDFLDFYISYFNYERPAYALEYKNPAQYTSEQGFSLCF